MAGLGSNTRHGSGSDLPPRLSSLMNRVGRRYAMGGPVPQAGAQPSMPQMPQAPQQGLPQPQAQIPPQQLALQARQVVQNPQVSQRLQQAIQQAIQSGQLSPDELNLIVQSVKAAIQNPSLYPRLRMMLIEKGLATEQQLPPNFDSGVMFALSLIAEAVQQSEQTNPMPNSAPVGQQPRMANGGSIPPRGNDPSGTRDNISIKVSGGEYVIPKHVVAAKGTEFFDRMLEQYNPNNPDSKVNKR